MNSILASLVLSAAACAAPDLRPADTALAEAVGAERIVFLEGGSLWSGALVRLTEWDVPILDQPLEPGAYLAVTQSVVLIGDDMVIVEAGDLIRVAPVQPGDDGIEGGIGLTCNVTCGSGWYACCVFGRNGAPPLCSCVKNGIVPACDGGGIGATNCSVTQP